MRKYASQICAVFYQETSNLSRAKSFAGMEFVLSRFYHLLHLLCSGLRADEHTQVLRRKMSSRSLLSLTDAGVNYMEIRGEPRHAFTAENTAQFPSPSLFCFLLETSFLLQGFEFQCLCYCPEGMLKLGIWGMYHLLAVSLLWLGIFQLQVLIWINM